MDEGKKLEKLYQPNESQDDLKENRLGTSNNIIKTFDNDFTVTATAIKSLTAEKARDLLKNYGSKRLYLYSLESIDEETAKVLASFDGDMICIGINSIDEKIAKNLAKFNGNYLAIGGHIKEIDAQSAKKLISFKGTTLDLGIEQIDTEIAKILVSFKGHTLYLCNVEKIDKEAAEILASFKGSSIDLRGLKSIDEDVIEALAKYKGDLTLYGLDKNTQYKIKLKKAINDNKKNNIQEEINEIENEQINEHLENSINKLKSTNMIKGWIAAEEIINELGNEIRNMGDNTAIKGVLKFFDILLYSIGYTNVYTEDTQLNFEDNNETNVFDYKENKIVKSLLEMYIEKFNKLLGGDKLKHIENIDNVEDYKYKDLLNNTFKDVPENIKNHLIENIKLIKKLGYDIDHGQDIEKAFEDYCKLFFNKDIAQALKLNISCKNLENKIKTRRQKRKGIKNVIQKFIKKDTENRTETNNGEKGNKGNILFDYNKGTINSRGKEVKIESINHNATLKGSDLSYLQSVVRLDKGTSWVEDFGPKREETAIKLEGLNINLNMDDGIWLANFKNRIKYKYGNKKIEYNKRRHTFYIENSELIKNNIFKEYFDIDRYCTSIVVMDGREIRDRHDRDEEEIMKKIAERLNN